MIIWSVLVGGEILKLVAVVVVKTVVELLADVKDTVGSADTVTAIEPNVEGSVKIKDSVDVGAS